MIGEIDIVLDQPRKIKFRFRDIDDLCRRLGNITVVQLLEKAQGGDTQYVTWGLLVGLRHEDSKLTFIKVQDLVEKYLEKEDTSMAEIIGLLDKAIVQSGMFGKDAEERGELQTGEAKPGLPR